MPDNPEVRLRRARGSDSDNVIVEVYRNSLLVAESVVETAAGQRYIVPHTVRGWAERRPCDLPREQLKRLPEDQARRQLHNCGILKGAED